MSNVITNWMYDITPNEDGNIKAELTVNGEIYTLIITPKDIRSMGHFIRLHVEGAE